MPDLSARRQMELPRTKAKAGCALRAISDIVLRFYVFFPIFPLFFLRG